MSAPAAALAPRHEFRVIGLVCGAHFCSHFYMLLLPPLFPVLREAYGVGYTELGLALTVYSLTTACTQAPVGFLVDRLGGRGLLIAGLGLQSAAIAAIGLLPTYEALLGLMVLCGLANAVYHPADYAILNASVDEARMGRAFSLHTFAGYLGSALAPAVMLILAARVGWQAALVACGVAGGAVALALAAGSATPRGADSADRHGRGAGEPGRARGLRLLLSLPIVLGLLFYVGLSLTNKGIGSFGVSVLYALREIPLTVAGTVVSAYLFASSAGVLAGGWVADRIERHDRAVGACFATAGAAVAAVALLDLPVPVLGAAFVVAGVAMGAVAPSRDMLIRSLTPPGEMGKVFGFVSTGFNLGGVVGPPLFGWLLDRGEPALVLWVVAGISVATVLTVLATGREGRRGWA